MVGVTILVIDDDAAIRSSLAEVLEDQGFSVKTASDGRRGMLHLATEPLPDVVLTDLDMPFLTGQQVYEAMRADPALARTPVVFMTCHRGRDNVPTATEVPLLLKPFKMCVLLQTIQKVRAPRS
jgi:CheY-like chemotaxis protein